MRRYRLVGIVGLALAAAGWWARGPLAAPAAKQVDAKWSGGAVRANSIGWKVRQGKVLLTFTGNVFASAPGMELQHADKATAETNAQRQFDTLTATGGVRFWARQEGSTQFDRVVGRCNQITIHNSATKKPVGDQRLLVADLVGNVFLELHLPQAPTAGAKPVASEPMTLNGGHAQVWKTANGLEGTILGEGTE